MRTVAAFGVLFALCGLGGAARARHHHHHHPAAGTVLTVADLGWPATTRSARLRDDAKVRAEPRRHGERVGKLAVGDRISWTQIVATADPCRAWLAIEPRGWVCAKELAPSDDDAAPAQWPHHVRAAVSGFTGLDLATTPEPADFAWVVDRHHPTRDVIAHAAAKRDATEVQSLAPRTVVPVLETDGDFARVGDGAWVARADLREVAPAPRPDGVAADQPWIDVDLDQQVLVAYRGDTRVFATLVSTGKRNSTPTGRYRITIKVVQQTMADHWKRWDFHDVPYILYFRKAYALHGAYWHDHFGQVDSVGCVNLTPADARWLFDWVTPTIPTGWVELHIPPEQGTTLRIRNRRDPDPRPFDYDSDAS